MESAIQSLTRCCLAALVVLAQPVVAATIAVTTDVDEYGTGAECSLREAVQSTNDNADFDNCVSTGSYNNIDTIQLPADVGDGIYTLSIEGTENDNANNDLYINDLTNGNQLRIEGVRTAGGADARPGRVIIQPEGAGFSGNHARFARIADITTLRHLTVRGFAYTTTLGGAIFASNDLTLEKVIMAGNASTQGGGAINLNGGVMLIDYSSFTDNVTDGDGGALRLRQGTVAINNSSFLNNVAGSDGGFLFLNPTDDPPGTRLDNVTAVGNSARFEGGALRVGADGEIQIRNTILAQNVSDHGEPNCSIAGGATVTDTDYNLIGANNGGCDALDTANTVTGAAPRLAAMGRYDGETFMRPPLSGSPAIDAGGCTNTAGVDISADPDQRNDDEVRNIDGDGDGTTACDIGAVERQKLPMRVDSFQDTRDQNPGDGSCQDGDGNCTLRAAIDEANSFYDLDEIILGEGVYTLRRAGANEHGNDTGDLDANSNMIIHGPGSRFSALNANGLDRGIQQLAGIDRSTTLALRGFSIIGGSLEGDAGAVSGDAELRLTEMSLTGNETTGAPANGYAALELDGGAQPEWASYHLVRTTVANNTASGNYLIGSSNHHWNNHIIDSTITGNAGYTDPLLGNGAPILEGEDGNIAVTEITSSTITDNSQSQLTASTGALITVHGSVVAGSGTDDCAGGGDVVGTGHNLEDGTSCGFANQNVQPQLAALADLGAAVALREPESGSPLVDAGDCNARNGRILPRTPYGAYRPQDGDATGSGVGDGNHDCDIGAAERQQIRTAPGANSPAGRTVKAGSTDVVMAQIEITNEAGQSVDFDNIGLLHLGSGSPDMDVSNVEIYHDVNDDGLLDGGDTLLGSDTYAAGEETINPTLTGPNAIASGATTNLLVVYDFSADLAGGPVVSAMRIAGLGGVTLLALLPFGRIFRRGAVLVLLVAAASLNGCGGDGGSDPVAAGPSQSEDFAVRMQTLSITGDLEGFLVTRTAGPNSNSVTVEE